MISLVTTFLNSEGNKHIWSFKEPDTTKSAEEIKESLELLASLGLFEKDGVGLFQKVVKAKYVETIETPIFEGGKLFGEPAAVIDLPAPTYVHSQAQTALNQHLQSVENEPEVQTSPRPANSNGSKQKNIAPTIASAYTLTKEKFSWRIRRKNRAKGREAPPDPPNV
ncbi:DUF2922 domain-containing protein [Enterococcus sp. AZ072]|uniref:DUF2922 domain-containing protein n=1 Tax=unclassified Enterococcus TaxID=2608891 RepID=UPI003D2AA84C